MKRNVLQIVLWASLAVAALFAVWSWVRPYDLKADPSVGCKIVETLVKRDSSFHWIDVHVSMIPGADYDLKKPVTLETARGAALEPADTTFDSDPANPSEIWFKFWLRPADLDGPLTLQINGGKLRVKSNRGRPQLGSSNFRNFTTHRW